MGLGSFVVRHARLWWIRNVLFFAFPSVYRQAYVKYLRKLGMNIKGMPDSIERSAYFDPSDYRLITLGDKCVISKEALLLTHDYSVTNAFRTIGLKTWFHNDSAHVLEPIQVGNNSFIGARAVLLPGTTIGDHCIIGAGAVVKGGIPDYSIVVGNPGKIISDTRKYAENNRNNDRLRNFEVQ